MSDLRFVDFLADTELVREARALAEDLLERDPDLEGCPELRERIQEREKEE